MVARARVRTTGVTMTTSASATSRKVQLAGCDVHLLEAGSGPPLLVLHHSFGALGWHRVHELLSERFSVTLPDLPGYATSTMPDWARDPRDMAILVHQLIELLGLRDVTLLGLGFGGFIAAEMATMSTGRLAGMVLVGAPGLKPESGEIMDQMLIDHVDYVKAGFRDEESFERVFGAEIDPEIRNLWQFNRVMTARVCWKPYMFNRRLPHLLRQVELPTLLVWGEQDRIVPLSVARQYERLLPNARLEILPGAGHLVDFEEPKRLAQLIEARAR